MPRFDTQRNLPSLFFALFIQGEVSTALKPLFDIPICFTMSKQKDTFCFHNDTSKQ